jgi:hypothetical protein
MNFKELSKAAMEVARDDCIRFGWLTPEDDVHVMSYVDPMTAACETYGIRLRDGVRLWTLTCDCRGRDIKCTFNPDLRKAGDIVLPRRPNSRLAAHEARWSSSP